MTHQTNEELREKIADFLGFHVNSSDMDKLMSLIPQPEQLEVRVNRNDFPNSNQSYDTWFTIEPTGFEYRHDTKQEALDFCKRFNLKVTNEEKK